MASTFRSLPQTATAASSRCSRPRRKSGSRRGPLKPYYEALVGGGLRAELARLTLARKIAAITLAVWKQQEAFDPARLKSREAR